MTIEHRMANAKLDGDTLIGLVTPFNVETTIGDLNRGGFHEKVNPGAFTKTLQERDVVLIHSHDTSKPLARTSIKSGPGSLTLTPDPAKGLRAAAVPVQTSVGKDVLALAEAGVIRGMSFGFEVLSDRWTDDKGRASDQYSGTHREILEVRLHEVTTTAFPAYPTTELSARDSVSAARGTERPSVPSDADLLREHMALVSEVKPHVPSLRSDILAAELATGKTKAERREARERFMAAQRSPEDARFSQWLRAPGHGRAYENRAAYEGSGSAGGYLVPPKFYDAVTWQLREYDGLLRDFELWESAHGEATTRPIAAQFTEAATASENTAFTEGPYPALTQQSWGQSPTYAASFRMPNQLAQDAFANEPAGYATSAGGKVFMTSAPVRDPLDTITPQLDAYVSRALGESLGRVVAPVAATALYSAITAQGAVSDSGGFLALTAATPVTFTTGATTELTANTISLDTAAQLTSAIDEAYQEGAKFYMARKQWAGILRQVDAQKHAIVLPNGERSLFGFPVVVTSQTSAAAASTVSGPVFGNLEAAMTLRVVGNTFALLRSTEKYAEYLQTYYRGILRADMAARDPRALVGVQYAAT